MTITYDAEFGTETIAAAHYDDPDTYTVAEAWASSPLDDMGGEHVLRGGRCRRRSRPRRLTREAVRRADGRHHRWRHPRCRAVRLPAGGSPDRRRTRIRCFHRTAARDADHAGPRAPRPRRPRRRSRRRRQFSRLRHRIPLPPSRKRTKKLLRHRRWRPMRVCRQSLPRPSSSTSICRRSATSQDRPLSNHRTSTWFRRCPTAPSRRSQSSRASRSTRTCTRSPSTTAPAGGQRSCRATSRIRAR